MAVTARIHIPLKCKCGTLQGIADVPASHKGGRFVCLCDDCQAYAHYLGRAQDVLDANGGTDIFPIAPANIKITQGIENLKGCRLSDKGMYRWYAGCCKTPIGNTLASTKTPYVGVCSVIMNYPADNRLRDSELGPVSFRLHGRFGIGPLFPGTLQKASLPVVWSMIRFMTGSILKRQHSPSPFVNPSTGQLRAEPYILTSAEREALRPLCGPKFQSPQN
jgi:hypothetical protein